MFTFRKKDPAIPTPALPPTETGKTAHRVMLDGSPAYVFTRAAQLREAVFHAGNVAFVDPDRSAGVESHEPDFDTLDESRGDFDYHASQQCAAMPVADADKVVIFARSSCAYDAVESLCKTFGAKSHPDSVRPAPAPAKPQLKLVPPPKKPGGDGPDTYGMCG
ncbi:MAG: hypothetical protein HYU57_06755 [Micavibrio aeruginosavorus]|nr:hypothetical protein [Micavibrio aeruginosavorus]